MKESAKVNQTVLCMSYEIQMCTCNILFIFSFQTQMLPVMFIMSALLLTIAITWNIIHKGTQISCLYEG